jgi:hypothetical protein
MVDVDRVDAWIDRVLRRADDLRRKGVLSIGVDGCTATFKEGEPDVPESKADDKTWSAAADEEPKNAWEDPASYPSGIVPSLEIDDLSREENRR